MRRRRRRSMRGEEEKSGFDQKVKGHQKVESGPKVGR
jgi:hypothetical protein